MNKNKKMTWKEVPPGSVIIGGGTAEEFKTGDWSSKKPIHDSAKCINCLFCWAYCPDNAIIVKDGKVVGIDYEHCKGCGICEHECPVKGKAIKLVAEDEWKKKE